MQIPEIPDNVDTRLYLSALYEYIKKTEHKISNTDDGYPPWTIEERLMRLLCVFVENEHNKQIALEHRISEIEMRHGKN